MAVVGLVAFGGCEFLGVGVSCTDVLVSGISLEIVDSADASPIVTPDLLVVATNGTYADTARLSTGAQGLQAPVFVVGDRPGVYDVSVSAAGYERWTQTDVEVAMQDECHVRTRHLLVRMQRS